jgi:phage FluMu protein Com
MVDAPNIRFGCPGCNKTLIVGSQHAGKRAKCPACGTVVQIQAPEFDQSAVPVSSAPTSKEEMIGVPEPICPYCNHQLEKMPGRKKKCPSCGNDIFVRTRPQDKRRILVRSDQLVVAVEEQWAI